MQVVYQAANPKRSCKPGLLSLHRLSHIERFSQATLLFWKKKNLWFHVRFVRPLTAEEQRKTEQSYLDNLTMGGWHNFCLPWYAL